MNELQESCEYFLHGHRTSRLSDDLGRLAKWCEKNDFDYDVYGQGEGVQKLEDKIASLLGFESAVYMPSGTMAQQIVLRMNAEKTGNFHVGLHETSHIFAHEKQAYQHLHHLKPVILGENHRVIEKSDLEEAYQPFKTMIYELPHRELGGQLPSWDELKSIKQWARKNKVYLHMDGARLWECKAYYKKEYAEIARGFQSVYVSAYKGLNGWAGCFLVSDEKNINEARVWQQRHGGNLWRRAPYVAALAMNIDEQLVKMGAYYEKTLEIAELLSRFSTIRLNPTKPQVNLFHTYLSCSDEMAIAARDHVAKETRVWLGRPRPSFIKAESCFETYVGENALELPLSQLEKAFQLFVDEIKRSNP